MTYPILSSSLRNVGEFPLPKLSIVMPVWNEEQILPELKRRLDHVTSTMHFDFEIIFSDDGSIDATPQILRTFAEADPRVIVVRLARNFGHQACLMAGLSMATGDAAILMDGDLEDPPELIPLLIDKWQDGGRVVIAQRTSRRGSLIRKFFFSAFHSLLQLVSDFPILANAGTYCLLDRIAYRPLALLPETNRFLPGLRSWVGFRREIVLYDREDRFAGTPRQTFLRLVKYGLDAIFSFSYKPLRLSLALGSFISLFAFLYGAVLVVLRLLEINVVPGFTTTSASLLFLGGAILVSNGILGEYIGRIYDEVKRRPLFLIEYVHREGSRDG